jgi:phage-related protein
LQSYDEYEYDEEAKNLHISYPYIGVDINIKNNDSTGITLYSNYYFTDKTKRFIAEGKITLDSKTDAIYVSELNRRENENN